MKEPWLWKAAVVYDHVIQKSIGDLCIADLIFRPGASFLNVTNIKTLLTRLLSEGIDIHTNCNSNGRLKNKLHLVNQGVVDLFRIRNELD